MDLPSLAKLTTHPLFFTQYPNIAKFQKYQNGFRGDGDEKEEEEDDDDDEDDEEEEDELPPPPLNQKDKKNKPTVGATKDTGKGKTTKVRS